MDSNNKIVEGKNSKKLNAIEYKEKVFDVQFFIFIVLFTIFIGLICFLPYLLTSSASSERLDFSKTGSIGDTISGTMSPFIAIAAALLTFIAFWVQYKANQAQTRQFLKQDFDTKIDRFENKFYELLRLHKENINEISIDGYEQRKVENRKAFASMYREFRNAFFETKIKYIELRTSGELTTECSDVDLLKLAYIFFYVGVDIHSDGLNKTMVEKHFDKVFYEEVRITLKEIRDNHKQKSEKKLLRERELPGLGKSMSPKSYRPFGGHLNRLGHYYRHLFQTVKFVVDNKDVMDSEKLEYLKTLRAQLSDYEQVMLYYNAVAGFRGDAWINKKYFTDFKMIHNLPLPLANFGISPQETFKNEIANDSNLFEWLS